MSITTAHAGMAGEAFNLLMVCRQHLEAQNIFQWTDKYPSLTTVADDIADNSLFVYTENGSIAGIITLNTVEDPEYKTLAWQDENGKPLTVHRLAVHPHHQGRDIAARLMQFAEEYAKTNGYTSIRFDSYTGNERSIGFYDRLGYQRRGQVRFEGRSLPFYCYEKIIK